MEGMIHEGIQVKVRYTVNEELLIYISSCFY